MDENELSNEVIGAAIEVHRVVGPGLLESVYRQCLAHELQTRGLKTRQELALPVKYKGLEFQGAYRVDLLVEEKLMVEL